MGLNAQILDLHIIITSDALDMQIKCIYSLQIEMIRVDFLVMVSFSRPN